MTLTDLIASKRDVYARCNGCGHCVDLEPKVLVAAGFATETVVFGVAARLYCAQCGSKDVTSWPEIVTRGARGEDQRR